MFFLLERGDSPPVARSEMERQSYDSEEDDDFGKKNDVRICLILFYPSLNL